MSRYKRAAEFVDTATRLWDSWEDDAVLLDRDNGRYADTGKIHRAEFVGEHLTVRGAFNAPRSPQGYPVLVQAGASNDGRAFAARYAEAIFTAHQSLSNAQAFYSDIKAQAKALGRNPDHIKILPGLSPFIGDTENRGKGTRERVQRTHRTRLRSQPDSRPRRRRPVGPGPRRTGPLDAFGEAGNVTDNKRSRKQVVAEIVAKERPTVRRLLHRLAGARGHRVFAGTRSRSPTPSKNGSPRARPTVST